jgi:dihydroxy-acid dehydratase
MNLNKYSKTVTQDDTQPAAQAMLHAIGMKESDFKNAIVGIASTGYEGNPCNMHLNDLSKHVKKGVLSNNVTGLIFNTLVLVMEFQWVHLECVILYPQEILLQTQWRQ